MKSACSSFRYNPRNLENPWCGLWIMGLLKLVEPFNNVGTIPQYALWYTLPEEEPVIEPIEEVDEGATGEPEDGSHDEHGHESEDEPNSNNDSDVELDLLQHTDKSPRPVATHEQDPDVSSTESLRDIPDGSASRTIPDFIALYILAEELAPKPHYRNRFERRVVYRIIHECCPLIVEIKSFGVNNPRCRVSVLSPFQDV
ncbi:hypothetical protein H4582DRAFT_1949489 [Lactarius indigo]|nr:hypothetical protein H4582DRAFT_1949489 [Lactarius indigo]